VVRRTHLVALGALAAAAWIARWAALEVASYLHRTGPATGKPLPREAEHPPGWMPGPFDA
jgi:hypothetical protein